MASWIKEAGIALGWICTYLCFQGAAFAMTAEVTRLQDEWAEIKYKTAPEQREQRFAELTRQAKKVAAQNPKDPEALIWAGIIESSYAGVRGGLGALSLVKGAKESLERAIEIDPAAMEGSGLVSLGSLYYQVPGWPISFGDDKKAVEFLRKGLALNPSGIDSNFFYADYLYRSGDLSGAEAYLRRAMKAPLRPGRLSADDGRRDEIDVLLKKIAEKKQ